MNYFFSLAIYFILDDEKDSELENNREAWEEEIENLTELFQTDLKTQEIDTISNHLNDIKSEIEGEEELVTKREEIRQSKIEEERKKKEIKLSQSSHHLEKPDLEEIMRWLDKISILTGEKAEMAAKM